RRSSTRRARRSSLRCLETAGREIGKIWAMRPAGRLPLQSKSRTARRVESARAAKTASFLYVTAWLRIMRNYMVSDLGLSSSFSGGLWRRSGLDHVKFDAFAHGIDAV